MSAILSSDDLNDFISPGVACIKPVETLPKEENSNPYEVTTEDKVQAQNPAPASISLTDCLACSGCVTSAEAVLVSLQSHTEVLNTLDTYPSIDVQELALKANGGGHFNIPQDAKLFVASVSPQVRASIAATFGISQQRAGNLIERFLSGSQGLRIGGKYNSGFTYVVDTNRMREVCLVLGADEVTASMADKTKPKPILTSACPGWICYAEKTHPHVLPHLSGLKSPQALTGTLLKSSLSKALGINPAQIWHLAIMPCFDKKLEASREELTHKWWSDGLSTAPIRDVDCVITSRELLNLAEARGVQLSTLPQTPISPHERFTFPDRDIALFLFSQSVSTQSLDSGTSGGYLTHILETHKLLNPGSAITVQKGRNADVLEFTLLSSTQEPLMKCARFYGFRNIQNLVRKLKPARQSKLPGAAVRRRLDVSASGGSEYAYVEVMACPGGCTNGGGQIKIEDVASILPQTRGEEVDQGKIGTNQGQKEWLARVDEAYFSAESDMDSDIEMDDVGNTNGTADDDAMDIIDQASTANSQEEDSVGGISPHKIHAFVEYWATLTDISTDKLAYTTFRKVESDVGKKSTAKKMGDSERIAAIAGLQGGGW